MAKAFFLGSLLLLNSTALLAAETDQFSKLDHPIQDSADLLNDRANEYLRISLETLNQKEQNCDEEKLYKELRRYYSNHLKGILMKEILKDSRFDKRNISLDESVFKGWTPWDGIGMGLPFLKSTNLVLTGVMRIGNQTIGTDKLEHFWGQGFQYFSKNYLDGKGEIKAVKTGIAKEKYFLGGNKIGNGVFSYGDLGANFNGMRFWNHVLQLRPDVLGEKHNIGPYVKCVDNKWVQAKEIDFTYYIDDSMDESINCSKFPSKSTVEKVKRAVKERNLTCPMDQKRLDNMIVKYGKMAKWIINEEGLDELKYFREFKD